MDEFSWNGAVYEIHKIPGSSLLGAAGWLAMYDVFLHHRQSFRPEFSLSNLTSLGLDVFLEKAKLVIQEIKPKPIEHPQGELFDYYQ
jgi:hypothetical protein